MRSTERLSTRTDTSDDAHRRVPAGIAAQVLEAIRARPRSVDELMADLRLSHSTCSARVNQLMRDGWIADYGVRSVTRSGRKAIVWEETIVAEPLPPSRATRAQLAQRIAKAQLAIASGCDMPTISRILGGEHHG